jgi:hypothetical protein
MKKGFLSTSVCFFLCIIALKSLGAPIRPVEPVDVSGTVSEIKWVPEEKLKGIPGMSGSAGHDRVIPEHFLVTLIDYDGVTAETARMMTWYLDSNALKDEGQKDKPSFILLRINYSDRNYLKKGMKIKVSGYTVRGDEGGTWTSYGAIDILRQPSLEWEIQNYLESHIESPSFGGKMFCAYKLFGIEKKGKNDHIYLWTLCMEYYVKDRVLLKGTGVSMPVALISVRLPQGSKIVEHKKPVDGQGYGESIRQIFPKKYYKTIFTEAGEYNKRAESLMKDVEKQAKKYFRL